MQTGQMHCGPPNKNFGWAMMRDEKLDRFNEKDSVNPNDNTLCEFA